MTDSNDLMISSDNNPGDEGADRALKAYLTELGGKLIRHEGVVALSFSGQIKLGDKEIPYAMIPAKGTLGKTAKWKKLTPAQRLSLVKERLNPQTATAFNQEVAAFAVKASLLCQQNGLKAERFWGPLSHENLLAEGRYQLILDRIDAAARRAREEQILERTKESVQLALYPESFHAAWNMRRRFIAVLGPTNSGKTHEAMEALSTAQSGVYLAPLRLLALENYERMLEKEIKVSLITGEERRETAGATHVASTVEMLDVRTPVDCAVIDEVQMLEDPDRGAAWTAAICGVPAKVVYLVGSLAAKPAIEALARRLNVEVEIRQLKRKAPLVMDPQPVGSVQHLKKGDALIAFSRRDVLYWRDQLTRAGLAVSTVYGSLSPEVRRSQAKRFHDGEADVIVATDAIGMGLNMKVSRVVFTTAEKYDGYVEDVIPAWLAQQIAGRAGRYGMHEAGAVAGFDEHTHRTIAKLLRVSLPPIKATNFLVAPTLDHLLEIEKATGETRLTNLLQLFTKNIDVNDEFFMPASLTDQIELATWLDFLPMPLKDKFLMSLVPISIKIAHLKQAWEEWSENLARGQVSNLVADAYQQRPFPLQAAEDACKKYSAYAWLSYRRPDLFPDGAKALELAAETSMDIDAMLRKENARKGHSPRSASRSVRGGRREDGERRVKRGPGRSSRTNGRP